MPASVTLEGMMLKAVPPWIDPIVTTAESSGEISRETTDCSDSTMRAAATIGSAVSCGVAPWPPRPSTSIANSSTAAISAPRLMPILPTGSGLQRWRPSAAATPSSAPSRTQASAPPAALLGGLEEKAQAARGRRAGRGARRRRARSRRGRRARRRACAPGSARRTARRASSSIGQGVHVGAQQQPRAVRPRVREDAGPADPAPGRQAERREPVRDDLAGARLLERELGMRWRSRRVATRSACSSFGKSARSFRTRAEDSAPADYRRTLSLSFAARIVSRPKGGRRSAPRERAQRGGQASGRAHRRAARRWRSQTLLASEATEIRSRSWPD